ncbi:MAG: hypothetical protein IIA14_12750 [SAR324 cluster bacterium]|nr:hypothetical protein [SAR324 cluster bacterium]
MAGWALINREKNITSGPMNAEMAKTTLRRDRFPGPGWWDSPVVATVRTDGMDAGVEIIRQSFAGVYRSVVR